MNEDIKQPFDEIVTKNKSKKLITILLTFAIVLLVTNIIISLKTSPKEESKVLEKELLETESQLVVSAIEKITLSQNCSSHPHVYLQDKKITAEDISNEDMYNIALQQLSAFKEYKDFTSEELRAEINKVAGVDYKFENKTYLSLLNWEYDTEKKIYTLTTGKQDCRNDVFVDIAKVTKAYKVGDEVTIFVRAIFVNPETKKYYKNRSLTTEFTDLEMVERKIMSNDMSSVVETIYSFKETSSNYQKGTLYKVIFEIKNGAHKFISSEPIKE